MFLMIENDTIALLSSILSSIAMNNKTSISVLFVCMGNICRSPTAHAVFQKLVKDSGHDKWIRVDSAGTHTYHIGEQPDRRSQALARKRGIINMSSQTARKAIPEDFERFDYVIAMDRSNYQELRDLAISQPAELQDRLHLFLDFTEDWEGSEVPDPYFGGSQGFERVFDMVASASEGLLEDILSKHGSCSKT